MKMVILEVAGDYAAVLSDDGVISRIPNQNYQVGQTLNSATIKQKNHFSVYVKSIAAVAAVFVLMLTGFGVLTRMPVTYVSLDVNPSVEYKLNMFDQVVEVVAFNEDAEEMLKDVALVRQSADEAIKQTVSLLGENNYLKAEEKNNILLSATGSVSNKSRKVLTAVTEATKEATKEMAVNADIIAIESSIADLKQATELGTTAGKMLLVNQIVKGDVPIMDSRGEEAVEVQDLLQKPVAELVSVLSEDELHQISQNNDSISYIPNDISDASNVESSETSDLSEETSSEIERPIPIDISEKESSNHETSSHSSSNISSSTSSTTSEISKEDHEVFDPSEIPEVNPGIDASDTEDETTSSRPENSLDIITPDDSMDFEEPSSEVSDSISDTSSEMENEDSSDFIASDDLESENSMNTVPDCLNQESTVLSK